ncbi:ADP-ribosyl cyclase/cyclic ADP-ribose hydrolase [Citrus sinensis]|nr:ADP-ribosyl cyclase/cyclic ADP-ribose hydrolase [Citrus sinensis]
MYDVFLSFRGEDTRDNFTSILHYVLSLKSIKTFIDDQLIRGENISHSLLDTIEASSISIIIFSQRYASSRWCLDELLKILECKHNYGQIVIPVFYHVDPSHVRSQSQDSSFGKYFSELEKCYPENMQRWKNALTEAANLSGFDSHVIRSESKLIEEIANDVLKRLDSTFQSENKGLVGVECPIEEIESLLCIGSEGVCKLGIWGIGGIGKTTIAGAVFNKISRHFEGSYFALNVREAEETGGIKDLQKKLLSELLNDGNRRNIESQLNRLARKKVLIVFDDVSHRRQIESLIGCLDELASGSRVIITTRDKQVLKTCWASQIYQMKELVYADAHKLFCQCAFGGDHPDASHTELTDRAIKYAQGVPLALKVLGCHLCGRSKEEWESAMRKLEVIPHEEIQGVLKISYDSLDDSQKNVFLDIACLLEGTHRDYVISCLDACGFEPKIELSVLECKSLINLDAFDQIRMHDLLRDMGREIVRNESIDYPGKRSRLWHHNDIYEVLKKNTGTEKIKGIFLDMNKVTREIHMNSYAFSKMPNLRFLRIYGYENKCMVSHLEGVPFAEVRHLEWAQCPLKTLNICAEKLVLLKMPRSKVQQLWDDVQDLVNLKEIDLSGSKSLTKLPDLSRAKNLEILVLELGEVGIKELPSSIECLSNLKKLHIVDCSQLESISSSIFKLKSLEYIEISNCSNFKRFLEIPSCNVDGGTGIGQLHSCALELIECPNIESLPSSLCMLKSLTSLEIIFCQNFKRLPDELGNLEALKKLIVNGTAIREVPESLGQLSSLERLVLYNNNLERLPESLGQLSSLEWLALSNNNLERLPESLSQLSSLQYLQLPGNSLEGIPEYLRSPQSKLTSLNFLSDEFINCLKLDPKELIEIVKDGWMKQSFDGNIGITKSVYFPGNEIPKWFRYQSMGSSVTLKTPPADFLNNKILVGFAHTPEDGKLLIQIGIVGLGNSERLSNMRRVKCPMGRRFGGQMRRVNETMWDSREEEEEEEEPHTKRLKCSSTPKQLLYVEHNDAISLVIIPAAQAPEIASSQVLRIGKEFSGDGNWLRSQVKFFRFRVVTQDDLKQLMQYMKAPPAVKAFLLNEGPPKAAQSESESSSETAWGAEC